MLPLTLFVAWDRRYNTTNFLSTGNLSSLNRYTSPTDYEAVIFADWFYGCANFHGIRVVEIIIYTCPSLLGAGLMASPVSRSIF
jgi:hypothetical protein